MFRILVVEDDRETCRQTMDILASGGYEPLPAENGLAALDMLEKHHVDLMVLDVTMPKMDGFELLSQLRTGGSDLPVVMLTGRQSLSDRKRGLRLGADDYMAKPADKEELLLRIGAILRRVQAVNCRKLTMGHTRLVYDSFTVENQDSATELPRKEFLLLYKLLSNPNKTFTRRQLMDEIWDLDTESDEHTVVVHINRLRERFRENGDFAIVTVRGLGYKAVVLGG